MTLIPAPKRQGGSESLSSWPSWSTVGVLWQSKIHRETLSWKLNSDDDDYDNDDDSVHVCVCVCTYMHKYNACLSQYQVSRDWKKGSWNTLLIEVLRTDLRSCGRRRQCWEPLSQVFKLKVLISRKSSSVIFLLLIVLLCCP